MFRRLSTLFVLLLSMTTVAQATTREELVAYVKEAHRFVESVGREKALAEFTKPGGKFHRGELYMYAYDFSGNTLAHGGRALLVGKNLFDMQDRRGLYVIREVAKAAKTGSGFVEYMWDNPIQKTYERKLGYVEKIDDTYFIGAGIYLGPAPMSELKR